MRKTIRNALAAAVLAGAMGATSVYAQPAEPGESKAQAQAKDQEQVPLTQKKIDDLIDAQGDVLAAQGDTPVEKADKATDTKVDAAAKKHGFSDATEFANVGYTVSYIMSGLDPDSKNYVGAKVVFDKEIAEIKADKTISEADRKQTVDQLVAAEKELQGAKPSDANVALVKANYDKINTALQPPSK